MKTAWKVILVLLYYRWLFGTPIISDNGLPLLIENIFQTPPVLSGPSVSWYLGYLSDPSPLPSIKILPIIWNWRVHNSVDLKLLTRLRLDLSHLNQHKFNQNFQDCLNPLCSCSLEIESFSHFFLHCHYYSNIRSTLNELQSIDINLLNQEDDILVEVLLYSSIKFNNNQNFRLLSSSIDYI